MKLTDRPCQVLRAKDGDTIVLGFVDVDGEDAKMPGKVLRIVGVNAPELHGATKLQGQHAKTFTEAWLNGGRVTGDTWPFRLTCDGCDDFGRLLGDVKWASNGESLADALLTAHQAVSYHP